MTKKLNENSEESRVNLVAISSVLYTLNYILPNVNKLLEDNMLSISESFTQIAQDNRDLQKEMKEFSEKESVQSPELQQGLESHQEKLSSISSSVSNAIIALQFQDRVSQNLVIAESISQIMFEDIISKTIPSNAQNNSSLSEEEKSIITGVIDKIFLGEIKTKFLDFMVDKGLISSLDEIGYTQENEEDKSLDHEIELF